MIPRTAKPSLPAIAQPPCRAAFVLASKNLWRRKAPAKDFLRPEMLGLLSANEASAAVEQLISQALFAVPEGKLAVRWGLLPKDATIDPIAISQESTPSWILDLDCFTDAVEPFDAAKLVKEAQHFSERIYTFFRWAVLPPFLSHYKGSRPRPEIRRLHPGPSGHLQPARGCVGSLARQGSPGGPCQVWLRPGAPRNCVRRPKYGQRERWSP